MSLIDEQEKMRLRNIRLKEDKKQDAINQTICISCKHRKARRGQAFCSRCTATGLMNDLRDQLPTSPTIPSYNSNPPQSQVTYTPVDAEPKFTPFVLPPATTYTRAQVVQMLGISKTTLSRWEKKGATPLPKKIAHSNQCVYTEENLVAIKEYMTREYIQPSPSSDGTPRALGRSVKKTIKINRRLERAVANRIGSSGRRVF